MIISVNVWYLKSCSIVILVLEQAGFQLADTLPICVDRDHLPNSFDWYQGFLLFYYHFYFLYLFYKQ